MTPKLSYFLDRLVQMCPNSTFKNDILLPIYGFEGCHENYASHAPWAYYIDA